MGERAAPDLWPRTRHLIFAAIERLLDTIVDPKRQTTVRDEGRQVISGLVANLKDRLARAGKENDRIEAEIAKLYAESERELAEMRVKNAEAAAREFDNRLRDLRLLLGTGRAMLYKQRSKRARLDLERIDILLDTVESLLQPRR